jgi:RNA polymerase sigma-70 factor (ECF subfamily)
VDDDELVSVWRRGEPGAGDALMRHHYRSVLRFFELRFPREAEDLAQQTFLVVAEARDRYRGEGSFRAYVLGIARLKLIERVRRAERTPRLVRFGEEEDGDGRHRTRVSTLVARRQEHRLVLHAMAALPVDTAATLQLYYWDGLATAEIAQAIGIPKSTVTTRLARAREALGREIRRLSRPGALQQHVLADLDRWGRAVGSTE